MTIPQQPADQNPGDRPDSARQEPARFAASAVDLQQLKNRAQATAGGANTAGLANSAGTGATGHTGNARPDRGTGTQIPAYFEVNEHNFETDVVRRSAEVPVVVLLGTSRAAESDEMKRNFEELVVKDSTLGKIIFGYVDADKHPAIVQAFRAEAVPTVVALGQGQPLTQFQGVQPVGVLQQWVDALIQQIGSKPPEHRSQSLIQQMLLESRILIRKSTRGTMLLNKPWLEEIMGRHVSIMMLFWRIIQTTNRLI